MDSSTSSPSDANGIQRQESPMSVQDQPVVVEQINGNSSLPVVGGGEESTVLTPEQEEERKLRLKYPNPQKPGGSTFIQKMLHKGCKKYFDSGDYNMAKSKTKAHVNANGANGTITAPAANNNSANSGRLYSQQKISEELSTPNTSSCSPNLANQSHNSSQSRLSTSPQTASSSLNSSTAVQPSTTPQVEISTPSTTSSSNHQHHQHHHHYQHYNQQTPSLHTRLSSTNINNSSPLVLFPSSSSSSSSGSSTTSTSTSSLHQSSSTSTRPLSSSTSASNIMGGGATAVMHVDPVLLNSVDEIGHGIPTPECLPQSRKHAISQSKLATPRLSTS